MEDVKTFKPSGIIRMITTLLRVARTLLIIGTVLAPGLLIMSFAGRVDIATTGVVEAPFTADLPDGRSIGVDGSGFINTYRNFEAGKEHVLFAGDAELRASFTVGDDDIDSRTVIAITVAVWLGAAWVGLTALLNIFEATAAGEPFAARSPLWLRWSAAALLVAGLVTQLASITLNRVVDTDLPIRIEAGPSPTVLMVTGLGILVLAELFAEAVRLREFEEATI
jgi:hypothetical protein